MGIRVTPLLPALSAVDAPVVANTASETSILGASGLCTFLSGTLGEGSTIGLRLFGVFSNKATSPGSITLKAKLGSTIVWSSGTLNLPATLHTDITFWLDILLMLRAGGTSAKVLGAGLLQAILSAQSDFLLPANSPTDSPTFDSTGDLDLDVTAAFSVADPGNKIQLRAMQLFC